MAVIMYGVTVPCDTVLSHTYSAAKHTQITFSGMLVGSLPAFGVF